MLLVVSIRNSEKRSIILFRPSNCSTSPLVLGLRQQRSQGNGKSITKVETILLDEATSMNQNRPYNLIYFQSG